MCPRGLSGPPAVTLTQWVEWLKYKKRSRCIQVQNHHQWFLAKQSSLKSWKEMSQKYQKKLKPKGMPCNKSKGCHVINPQNYNFNKFQKFWCSQSAKNQLKSNVELGYMCPRRNSGPQAVTFTKWLKWCVHARYMKVLSVIVSTFKKRMEKKLGERREKWGAMHRLVVSFLGLF